MSCTRRYSSCAAAVLGLHVTWLQYLSGTVVNALGDQHEEFLLKELVRRWNNHKIMNQWMQKFFQYLDRWELVVQRRRRCLCPRHAGQNESTSIWWRIGVPAILLVLPPTLLKLWLRHQLR